MSGALSIAPFPLEYTPMNPFIGLGSGFSSEAQALSKIAALVVQNFEQSQALFGKKSEAISELRTLENQCADRDWDGYNARAVDPQAVLVAEDFVRALPRDLALPEFAPEPDGSVSLDWIHSPNRVFSMSIGGSNRLAFAWLDGTDRGHGVAYFDGEMVPQRIYEGIKAVTSFGNAPLRVA